MVQEVEISRLSQGYAEVVARRNRSRAWSLVVLFGLSGVLAGLTWRILTPVKQDKILILSSETYLPEVRAAVDLWNRQGRRDVVAEVFPPEATENAKHDFGTPMSVKPDIWIATTSRLVEGLAEESIPGAYVNGEVSGRIVPLGAEPLVFLAKRSALAKKSVTDAKLTIEDVLRKRAPLVWLASHPQSFTVSFSCADLMGTGSGNSVARYLEWSYRTSEAQRRWKSMRAFLGSLQSSGFRPKYKLDSAPLADLFVGDQTMDFVITHRVIATRTEQRFPGQFEMVQPRPTIAENPEGVVLEPRTHESALTATELRRVNHAAEVLKYLQDYIALHLLSSPDSFPATNFARGDKWIADRGGRDEQEGGVNDIILEADRVFFGGVRANEITRRVKDQRNHIDFVSGS